MNSERDPAGREGPAAGSAELSAGSVAGLRSLREGLGTCLTAAGCEPNMIADAQLVLAEIATNAFVHDAAPQVRTRVECGSDEITLTVSHAGDVLPPPSPAMATHGSTKPGGRGLAIVDQIALSRDVANADGLTTSVIRLAR